MRVHQLNCATMCPYGAGLLRSHGGLFSRTRLVCRCLLVESSDGLVLVDTGLGMGDIAEPKRLGRTFTLVAQPQLEASETAIQQIVRLGFRAEDVRHIVMTHLDVDHAGGLSDFPKAHIHVSEKEHVAALDPQSFIERHRYIPEQWAHGPIWELHGTVGDSWFGFESVQSVNSRLTDILLIPLYGHTRGHCGVAVRGPKGWLLHCGDAYFSQHEMEAQSPQCPVGLRLLQRFLELDGDARRQNQARLRRLAHEHSAEVTLVCAHDPKGLTGGSP